MNTSDCKIQFCTHQLNYPDIPVKEQDRFQVHKNVSELLPSDAPKPLGEHVTLTHCVDANLMHDLTTGCSVIACLHFANGTPIDWHSKK